MVEGELLTYVTYDQGKGKGMAKGMTKGMAKGSGKSKGKREANGHAGYAPCLWVFADARPPWGPAPPLLVEVLPSLSRAPTDLPAKRMRTLWQDRSFADCVIECNSRRFDAHRAVLCAASPVFSAAFKGSMREAKEARFKLRGCQPCAAEAMLEFVYTGCLPELDCQVLLELLPIAVQYELKELCSMVAGRLCSKVTVETVRDVVKVMKQFSEHTGVGEAFLCMKALLKENDELFDRALG